MHQNTITRMGTHAQNLFIQMGNTKSLTDFTCVVEYRPISMSSFFCFETKSKRKPDLQRELSDPGMFRLNRK